MQEVEGDVMMKDMAKEAVTRVKDMVRIGSDAPRVMVRMRMKDADDMARRSMKTREEDDVVGMKNTKERGGDLTMVVDAIRRRESMRVKEGYVALRKDMVERHTRR